MSRKIVFFASLWDDEIQIVTCITVLFSFPLCTASSTGVANLGYLFVAVNPVSSLTYRIISMTYVIRQIFYYYFSLFHFALLV